MIEIIAISYVNENGERVDISFAETDVEYRADRITDLVREMLAGGRKMGPPPQPVTGGRNANLGIGGGK